MAFQYRPLAERFPKPGMLESAGRNLIGSAANVVGLGAAATGQFMASAAEEGLPIPATGLLAVPQLPKSWGETVRDTGLGLAEWGQKFQQPAQLSQNWEDKGFFDRVTNWDYWSDPQGATADIASGIGSSLPFFLVGGVGGRAASALLPTRQLANRFLFELGRNGGKFGQSVNNFARSNLGKALGETADTGINYAATTAPLDAMTNAAEIIKPLKERGFTDSEISRLMLGSMAEELPVDLAENFITGNTIFGKGFGLRGKTWKGRLGYGSLNIPLEMGGEYVQEGYQTRGTQKYQGLPHTESPIENLLETGELFATPEEKSAATSGALGGMLPAAAGTAYHTVTGKDESPQENTDDNAALRSWTGRNTDGVMSDDVHDMIVRAAKKYGVPVERALAQAMAESTGNPYAKSPAGAIGIMQLMPDTARGLGVDPYDVEQNIDGGVRYLKKQYDQFGDWDLAHAAYNAGAGAVEKYGGIPDYPETQNYVARINGFLNDLPDYQGGEESNEEDEDIYVGENGKGEGTYWAQAAGVDLSAVRPEHMSAIDMLGKWLYEKTDGKFKLLVTSGKDGSHAGGEFSHDNGWKIDVVETYADGNSPLAAGEDGPLTSGQYTKGELADEFIKYGRSLGLGMNWHYDMEGTDSIHFDISFAGDQWDGNGENAGGFNPKKGRSRKGTPNTNITGATADDEDSDIQPAKSVTFDDIIKNILQDNSNAQFNINSDDEGTLQAISDFAASKRDTATGEAAMKLQDLFKPDGEFDPSHKNLKTLNEIFGDELKEFGQGKFNERWSNLLQKSTQPNFIENLTDDDRKLFGNILKQKLKDAGIDLKGMPAVKQGLEKGDEKTFINAWQALQDRMNKTEDAEPIISDKTQKALDDIHARINELTTNAEENAPQIDANSKLYREINKLNGEINKLTADREKLSQTKGNQAAQVDAAGKIAKIDADIQKKQAELDAKIDSFYNPPQPAQPVKVEPSERFAPIKAQADATIEQMQQDLDRLEFLGVQSFYADEMEQLTDRKLTIQNAVNELAKLDEEVGAAIKERNTASKAGDFDAYAKAKKRVKNKLTQYTKKEQELQNLLNPQEETVQEEPAPVKVEPSKFFAQAKTQADNAIEDLNRQIETLKSQGVAEDSPEIEQLTDKKYAIQAAVDELTKHDADAETAKKKKADANKANDTKAYNSAESQRKKAVNRFKNTKNKLQNLLNPQEESTPVQEEPVELATEFANELDAIQQRKKELRDSGAPAKDITALNQRRDKIKEDGTEIAKLKKQVEDLDNQIQTETDPQKRETLEDKRDGLQAQIEDKSQKLSNFINPPPKPQKKTPKTYAPVDDRVVDENSRLNQQILDAPDTEMPEVGKGDTPTTSATKRLKELWKRNNAVGQAQDDVLEKGKALQEARANGDEQAIVAAKSAFETAKENLAQKKKELDDFFATPVKKEKQPAPFEPYDEETGNRINDLNNLIDTEQDAASINSLRKERDALVAQSNAVSGLQKKLDAQQAIMNDTTKNAADRRKAKETYASVKPQFDTERTKLDDLLHPRNEDEEPAETYAPVDDSVKNALEEFDRQIAQAPDGSAEKANLEAKRREIENQNETVAKLRDERKQLEKDLSRKQVGSKGYRKVQNALDNKNRALANAEKKLAKLLAQPKPKEQKQEQPKPKKYEPVDTETKEAIAKLKRDIKKLNEQISDAETDFLSGKSNSKKLDELEKSLKEKKSLLKQIQAQSDKCSELKDKAATALRIRRDTDKPQAERDKASDALSNYGAQLSEELQKLHDLIPPEPVKAPKEKSPSKKTSEKKNTSKPQTTPVDESQSTPETPATDVQSESQSQESAPEEPESAPEQSEMNAQSETQAEESPAEPVAESTEQQTEPKQSKKKSAKAESEPQKEKQPQQEETAEPEQQESSQPESKADEEEITEPEQQKTQPDETAESESNADEEEYRTDDGSTFGSIEAAEREMIESLKELGIEPRKKENTPQTKEDTRRTKLVNWIDDSDEAIKSYEEDLKRIVNRTTAMPMFDPELWVAALKLGAAYVQRGINNFADWAAKLTEIAGEKIEPWQNAIWETIDSIPRGSKFDEKQMMNVSRFIGALREKGYVKSFDDVQAQFEQRFDKEAVEKILPMIRASYTGIEKYFADQKQRQEKAAEAAQSSTETTEPTAESQDEESSAEQKESRQDKGGISDEETEEQNQPPIEETEPAEDEAEEPTGNETVEEEAQPQSDNEETPTDIEESEPAANEITYPNGALTYGDKTAVEGFKGGRSDKKFDENMSRKVKINGQEMTRLEAVENIAKGELDESAMKLNKKEREYLEWLKEKLLEPLQKIQQAGIQNEQASKAYQGIIDNTAVYFEDSKGDATTLANLEKLAEAFGGRAEKNASDNTRFNFTTAKDAWAFDRAADFFMNNRHLPYFSGNEKILAEQAEQENRSPIEKAWALLENISLPEGVTIGHVAMKQDKKGVWQVKLLGSFPVNAPNERSLKYNVKQSETNNLVREVAKLFNGGLYADATFHFKDKENAEQFKQVLDEYFGLKKKSAVANSPVNANAKSNETNLLTAIDNLADTRLAKFNEPIKSFSTRVRSWLDEGSVTQEDADKILSKLMNNLEGIADNAEDANVYEWKIKDAVNLAVREAKNQLNAKNKVLWGIFGLRRAFELKHKNGKVDDEDYKLFGNAVDQLIYNVVYDKTTPLKAYAGTKYFLDDVTKADLDEYISTAKPSREAPLFRMTFGDVEEAVEAFGNGYVLDMDAVKRGLDSGELQKLVDTLPERTRRQLEKDAKTELKKLNSARALFKSKREVKDKAADVREPDQQPSTSETETTPAKEGEQKLSAEQAVKQIDELIAKWNKESRAEWDKDNLIARGYSPPTEMASELSELVTEGVIAPEEAVDAANKLLNGTEAEQKEARKTYHAARKKLQEKRVAEFNPQEAKERLKKIAEKFPVLKKEVEREIKYIDKGDVPVNDKLSLTGRNDDEVEQWATYNLIDEWAKPYQSELYSAAISGNSDSAVAKIYNKANEILNRAEADEILTQGIYKQVEKLLNSSQKENQGQPDANKSNGIVGNTAEVITGSRTPHQIRYKVVEANDLNSSHTIDNGGVFANENYPAELQPRDRTRVYMQAQLISMGNNLNPTDLLDARNVNQGAPVTRQDGVVLNGNGRTAAIRYAYENGKGKPYKDALIQNAEKFGLNADEISKMNQPILVRELTSDLTDEELRDITNTQTGGEKMGASEQAQVDAAKLSQATLNQFPKEDYIDLTHAKARDFLQAAIGDLAKPDGLNNIFTRDGKINQDGINRVKRALFALAYGDSDLIARMSESTDDNVRGVTNALLNAAPTIAKVKTAMKNGTLHNYDLNAITDAVKKLSALRDEGTSVSTYLQEQSLFAEHADSEEVKEILSFFDKNKRAPNKIAAFLKNIANQIQKQGDPRQENLFGKNEPAPLIDLIRSARREIENNGQQDLFAQSENPAQEKAPESKNQENEPSQKESTDTIEQRALEVLKAAGLEGKTLKLDDGRKIIASMPKIGKDFFKSYVFSEFDNKWIAGIGVPENYKIPKNYKRLTKLADKVAQLCNAVGQPFYETDPIYAFATKSDATTFSIALNMYFGNDKLLQEIKDKMAETDSENIYFGNEEASGNEESGTGERLDDGHRDVEPAVREGTDEEARTQGRTEISGEDTGQQRRNAESVGERNPESDAESARPAEENDAGSTSTRTGTGTGIRGDTRTVQPAAGTESGNARVSANADKVTKPYETSGHNFQIDEDSGIGEGGLKEKFKQNVAAIKLLKQLEAEGRKATPSEQAILAKFNGWGTLRKAFSDDADWEKENQQLKELLTDEEYKSAREASPNAFYTHPKIALQIWQGLEQLGFKGGRILDPSMGSGIFFGTMPSRIAANSELTGGELDSLTGRIAKQLYQQANINIEGFQDNHLPKNYYDLAISNVPFGTIVYRHGNQKYDIHNYFFAEAIDKVRPGGLVAFITGTGTMQASGNSAVLRTMLSGQADLIAAFKLPGNAFEKNANTQVTTDVLILQKRVDPKTPSEYAQDWSEVGEYKIEKKSPYSDYTWEVAYPLNKYFLDNPNHMLGTPTEDTLYGGRSRLGLDGKGRDVIAELHDLMNKLPKDIYKPVEIKQQSTIQNTRQVIRDSSLRDKSFVLKDGKVYQARQYLGAFQEEGADGKPITQHGVWNARELVEVPKANQERVKDFIALEKATDNILMAELDPATTDEKLFNLRQRLNKNYDTFVEKYGYLNSPENVKILGVDPNFGRVAAIEIYNEDKKTKQVTAKKADIFSKRTVGAIKEPTAANNVNDALTYSLSMRGRLDLNYMAKLLGKSEREVIKELGDQVFENPVTRLHELAEEYLSGNVREKLAAAEQAAKHNPNYNRNVEALRKVQPIELTEHDIKANVGAPWIDVQYYNQFLEQILGADNGYHIEHNKTLGKWTVVKPNKRRVDFMTQRARNEAEIKNSQTWGIEDMPFTDILDLMLNLRPLVVKAKETYMDENTGKKKTRTVTDTDATAELKAKAKEIQAEFDKWLWSDDERKADLLKTFNEEFNSEIERKYDGSRFTFHDGGLAANIELRPHQKDAVWRIMQGKNTLLAHTVGAGKTWEMVVSAMEMKRLGMIRKPLFVLPQNILRQFEAEFRKAYSQANLLVLEAEDLPGAKINLNFDESLDTKKHSKKDNDNAILDDDTQVDTKETDQQKTARLAKRRAALSRIATEDWDGIIISHSLFKSMPMSAETYRDFYQEMKDSLEESYKILKERGENDATLSQIVQAIKNLETKLQEDIKEYEKEVGVPFEQLGIDQIFVDEADCFKNLKIPTAMGTISGLQTGGSQRSLDMYVKTKWLTKMRNGGGVVFATGTPVSNSLSEIFTMQRYLDANTLEEKDWQQFDSWASMFTKKDDIVEMNPDGSGLRQNTYLTLQNLRILARTFRKFADIKLPQDLPFLKRPALKNGQRTIIEVEPTEAFIQKRTELTERAKEARGAGRKKGADNMLAVTNDMRQASIDLQMLDPSILESEAGNKIPVLCDTVVAKYKETADVQGAQLIFSDIGTPQAKGKSKRGEIKTKSVYEKIKRGLIERGIPANQIAFVHDAKDSEERQALFERVNNGDIRVIIGSTTLMGAGTNFQKHLVALHHLDCPWRPRDIEQREGRILRNGNQNEEVEIFTYVTRGSYDANMWEKVKRKKEMIDSFMSGDPTVDEIVESPDALTFGEAMAAAMDNPLLKERTDLGNKLTELEILARAHRKRKAEAKLDRENLLKSIPTLERQIKNEESDVAEMKDITGDNFKIKLGDRIYKKPTDAKETLTNVLENFNETKSTKIGEIGGFDIMARVEKIYATKSGVMEAVDKNIMLQLVNHGSYFAEEPTLNGIRKVIKSLKGWLNADKVELDKQKSRLAEDEKQIEKPFAQAAELEDTRRKFDEIDSKINGTKNVFAQTEETTKDANQNEQHSKGKWHMLGSASTREDLQKLIREHYGNDTVTIKDDGTVFDEYHERELNYVVRNDNGIWQYGYYKPDMIESIETPAEEQNESAEQPETTQPTESVNDAESESQVAQREFTPEEIELINLTPETLTVDDRLKTNLHEKFPSIKKAIDIWAGIANTPLQHDRRKDGVRLEARKKLLVLLKANLDEVNAKNIHSSVAEGLYATWNGSRIAKNDKSAKTENIREEALKLINAFYSKKISAQEFYQQMGELLYPKEFAQTDTAPSTKKTLEFETGEFTHSKTGEKIPQAKLKDRVEREEYLRLNNLAKKHGGYYSKFSKSFLFKSAEGRDAFVNEAAGTEKSTNKAETVQPQAPQAETQPQADNVQNNAETLTDAQINEAAKNPDTANALEQLGAKIENGKVITPDEETNYWLKRHVIIARAFDESKSSLRGSGDTTISNFVDPKDLTDQQKLIQRLGADMGVRVVFYSNENGDFHGAHAGNISYINVNSKMPLGQVFWHESSHWIKSANPELWERIRNAAGITDAQRKAYLKETGRTDLKTDEQIDEEIISDYFEDSLKREGFFSKIGRKDPSLIQRVIAWLQDAMSKFFEYFNNPKGKLTNDQKQRMAHEFGRVAGKLVNQNGQKIFRYNNRTHALTLPDGSKLSNRLRTSDLSVDFQHGIDDNDNEISQEVFDKYLNDGIMQVVRDTIEKEIGEYVDLSKMSDPVARDEARDKLPYIKQMLTRYNLNRVQDDEAYKNRLAVKIEYARRCFDSDGRIQNEAVRQMDRYDGQSGIREARSSTVPRNNAQGTGRQLRRIDVGVSRHVSGGKSAARKHFLKLYNEIAQKRHSGKRGVFSNGKTTGNKNGIRSERQVALSVDATAENRNLAEQFGGRLENGRMVFYNTKDAKAYTEHVQNMERGGFKYSFAGNGDLKRMFAEAKPVTNAQLNGKQRKWVELGKSLGVKVQWIDAHTDLKGALKDGVIYLNRRANDSVEKTFWHEQFHLTAALQPELYRDLLKYFSGKDAFSKGQLDAYRKENNRTDLTDAEVIEEILSDNFGQVQKRVQLLRELGRDDSSLAERFVAWLKYLADKVAATFRNPEGGMTTAQRDAFIKGISDLADSMQVENAKAHTGLKFDNEQTIATDAEYLKAVDDYQNAKTDNQRQAALNKLQDMVQQAAEAAGFYNAVPEQTVAYKVRTTAAPKKTIKVYKVFTVADDGSPTALFIGGTEKLPQNVWLDAQDAYHFKAKNGKYYVPSTQNPFTKGGKTGASVEIPDEMTRQELIDRGFLPKGSRATKITALAYRPGWHAGTLPFFPQGGTKRAGSNYENIHRYNQVVFECEMAAEKNYTSEAEAQPKARTKSGKLNSREADLQYMPENGFYYYATNPLTHGHPELGNWVLSGSLKINRALTQEECDKILADNGKPPQEWEQGTLNLEELGYTGEQNDTARKTLAPITYDDNGEIIPLSKRFDATKNDIRFSGSISEPSTTSTTKKLKAKIDNFLWSVKNERPRNHMRKLLEKLSGYQIRSGHVAEGIDILVKDISKVIRTPNAYEWKKILPEVGKLVAKRLNLNPTTEQGNYIASWLMDGAPNDTSQAAKDFQRAMRETDDMYRDQLLEVQSIFSEWNNRPPEQIVKDAIEYDKEKKPLVDKAKGYLYEGYEQFIEELYPVKQLVDQYEEDNGKKLAADKNPLTLLRNSRGIAGRAKIMVEGGENVIKALKAAFPNIDFSKYKTPFKTIYEILDSVDALENKENRKEFSAYLLACSVKDLHKRNAENLRQQAVLRDKIDTLEDELDTLTDKKKIKETEKRIEELQKEIKVLKNNFYATPFDEYETAYDNKVCDGTIAKYKDKYGQAQRDMMRYSHMLLDIMVDSGLLSEDKRAGYLKNFPNHVPMFRKFDENEDKSFGDSLKAMTGSSRDVIDPLNSIIKNTYDFVRRAEKNKAKILLANLARTGGVGNIIEERTFLDEVDNKKPDVNTTITFYENGEKKYLETDPAVVKAVNNLSIPQMSWITKLLRVGTTLLRNFATVFNPAFAFRNLIMDNQNAFLYNKYGMWSPADFVRGFLSVWNRDADYNEWMAMGGAQASFWSVDRDYTQASLDRLRKGRWGQYKSFKGAANLFSFLGEYSELATRVGYYKKAKKALAAKNGGKIDRSVLLEAALESRDLTDFARGGKASRSWNNAVAFANASIQGWDKFFRTYDPRQYWSKDPEVKKEWERAMIRLALGSIAPTVLCFLINTSGDDDDWYEKDLPDWERQTHWILGENIRIPKGQDVGLRFFSNLTESMLRYMAKNDPKAFENWWKPAWEAIPDFVPTALQPIIECATNYDMFRKNAIVPARQQHLPEYMQYDNRTSALAKGIGDSSLVKFLISETGVAPAKVDHFLYGYYGKLGQDFVRLGQNVLGVLPIIGKDEWVNYERFSDLPIISGIKSGFLRVPYRNPRILTEYYETLDEQTKLHNEFKLTKKRPEGYNHSLYTKLQKAQEQMRELTKKERKVLDDTHLDGDERDNRQLAIQKKRVALAERVLR